MKMKRIKSVVVKIAMLSTSGVALPIVVVMCSSLVYFSFSSCIYWLQRSAGEVVSTCESGSPCRYPDRVQVRVIVIAFNRPASLQQCLARLQRLETDGDSAAMEIWLDRDTAGQVHVETLTVASAFNWERGPTRVHVQEKHAGATGQWLNSWRPRLNETELALFVEDDVDLSPYAYRWTKTVHSHFDGRRSDFVGVTLQDEYLMTVGVLKSGIGFRRPVDTPVFLYQVMEPWGFTPSPGHWRLFQDWYYTTRTNNATFRPILTEAKLYTKWYKEDLTRGHKDPMWHMWFIYYMHVNHLYVAHCNLAASVGRGRSLSVHRREPGLHFTPREVIRPNDRLLFSWNETFVQFPDDVTIYDYDGVVIP